MRVRNRTRQELWSWSQRPDLPELDTSGKVLHFPALSFLICQMGALYTITSKAFPSSSL